MSDVNFIKPDSCGHWYTKDGQPRYDADLRQARKEFLYTSVSTICAEVRSFGLELYKQNQIIQSALTLPRASGEDDTSFARRIVTDAEAHSKAASEWGTGFHKAVEEFERGKTVDPAYQSHMLYYQDFREHEISIMIDQELVLIDHDVPVAGRCDTIYLNALGEHCILDYKTTTVKKGRPEYRLSWLMQLAAYREAYRKMKSLPVAPHCKSVVVNSAQAEPFYSKEWTSEELDHAYQAFCHLAWYWHFSRNYHPNGSPQFQSFLPALG